MSSNQDLSTRRLKRRYVRSLRNQWRHAKKAAGLHRFEATFVHHDRQRKYYEERAKFMKQELERRGWWMP